MAPTDDRHGGRSQGPQVEETLVPTSTATGVPPGGSRVLGGRYEVRGVLGRGGMGEVWLARDLKLQVDVALKVVRPERLDDEGALARLRAEVRSARAVASPHVCRVYDLVEAERLECISMEYVDGTTLKDVLARRGPLELSQAREIALQMLAGLSAIHEAGLVHRDVKPENVMLTRAGRVVLMDFGIAKAAASGGTVAGTPAYWPPEQAAGAPADPRADVFAAGIVLAEMVAPGGREAEQRRALLQALREDPPRVPDGPWSESIRRAVAREPGDRYPSAQALARALEEVAHRVTGIEEAQPYPGLSSFTEADAEYFFGREAEVEGAWKRLPSRHLLAVVGPSGAGKSSFLRAGLIPARPEGWAHLICTPGDAPFVALGQALVPEVSRDTEAMRQMLRFENEDVAVELFRRWRSDHREALVIVDQLEELFTLNPPEVQARFASLLGRLVLEADVHVLLAIRDDFLLRCQEHEALRPVFSELMPLGAPAGESLRRALVQPALRCGYRFEDDALVGEMLQAVEGERGALPLLAFAAASLWERRDREAGLLTRAAHQAIGGVAGALAQHAEATLERIGAERLPLVRELFRNLVTSQGTRDVRAVDELLTVFAEGQRADAEAVLKALVDARLLTSYEAHATEPGQTAGRRVEVVHESLLKAWPRLVRWQAQDEEGAVLRDQLRQAARLWEEKGQSGDLLWTGTAYQEFELWRGRYPGALTSLEERFAKAMADKARRKRRLVRMAAAAVVIALTGVIVAVSVSRHQAVVAARRAEAAKLLAIGQERLALDPTVALAYATASIDVADSNEGRLFALRAIWEAPPALELIVGKPVLSPAFNPDGRLLAVGGYMSDAFVFREDGGPPAVLTGHWGRPRWASGDRLLLVEDLRRVSVWSLPAAHLERTIDMGLGAAEPFGSNLLTVTLKRGDPVVVRRYPLSGGDPVEVLRLPPGAIPGGFDFAPGGTALWFVKGPTLVELPFAAAGGSGTTVVAEHLPEIEGFLVFGNEVVTWNRAKEARLITVEPGRTPRVEDFPLPDDVKPPFYLAGGYIVQKAAQAYRLWKRDSWLPARPLSLRRDLSWYGALQSMHPAGDWLVASTEGYSRLTFWPLKQPRPVVVDGFSGQQRVMAFSKDGRLLATGWPNGPIRLWPLTPGSTAPRTLAVPGFRGIPNVLAFDPGGRFVFCVGESSLWVVPVDGRPPMQLKGFTRVPWINAAAVSPSGRSVAAAYATGEGDRALRVWDVETGASRAFDLAPPPAGPGGLDILAFAGEAAIYGSSTSGVHRWDLASGRRETVLAPPPRYAGAMAIAPDQGLAVVGSGSATDPDIGVSIAVHDLARGTSRPLPEFGTRVLSADLDPTGRILVTVDRDGIIRVGRLSGGEPHLLVGHRGGGGGGTQPSAIVSPDLKWIASAGEDNTLRLWPMPDLDAPPLHAMPREALLAKLRSLTNIRAVRDAKAVTGWKVEVGPFPGWAKTPEWRP